MRSPETVRDLVRQGQYLQAYDIAVELIQEGPDEPEIRYLAVLALARSGATGRARSQFEALGLGSIDGASVPERLAEDLLAIGPRLDKDTALSGSGDHRTAWSRKSAEGYQAAFARTGSAYLGVNSASMWLISGERDRAESVARDALAGLRDESDYWTAATEAEAALLVGDLTRARGALAKAGAASEGDQASRATTLKQLRLLCQYLGLHTGILSPIHNKAVVHYCGHRILPRGEQGRFPSADEGRVSKSLAQAFSDLDVGIGIGSLAAGADILAAEALLDRGAELHIVLPFDRDEFVRSSVAPAGDDWIKRFEVSLAAATNVTTAIAGEYLDDPVLFDFCSRIAMGNAVIRARFLEADVRQVAVWDGTAPSGVAGTAVDVGHWKAAGRETVVIGVDHAASLNDISPSGRRRIAAIVFGDFAGFSKLTDGQLVVFQEHVMGALSTLLEPFRDGLLSGRTWGDGIYLVFEGIQAAADAALTIQAAMADLDFQALGLSELTGLRLAAHATPVFDGWDPIADARLFYGAGVTQAARIEPRTPEGEIYTTQAFASLAVLTGDQAFDCQYVGTMPTAKGYGSLPLFNLSRNVG